MISILQCARGAVHFHLPSGSTENSIAFFPARMARLSSASHLDLRTETSTENSGAGHVAAFGTRARLRIHDGELSDLR
jgi:hypothetical protein